MLAEGREKSVAELGPHPFPETRGSCFDPNRVGCSDVKEAVKAAAVENLKRSLRIGEAVN